MVRFLGLFLLFCFFPLFISDFRHCIISLLTHSFPSEDSLVPNLIYSYDSLRTQRHGEFCNIESCNTNLLLSQSAYNELRGEF